MNSTLEAIPARGAIAVRTRANQTPDGTRARLATGVAWVVVVSGLSQGSAFLASIISARLLGGEEFGQLAMIQSVLLAAGSFASMGLGVTATKMVAELRQSSPERVGRVLGLCMLIAAGAGAVYTAGVFFSAHWVAQSIFKAEHLTKELQLGAAYVLFTSLNAFQVGALSGFEAFSRVARLSAWQGAATLALTTGLTWIWGLDGGIVAMVGVMACSWVLFERAYRAECRRHRIRIQFNGFRSELPMLTRLAIPAALSGCVGGLAISAASALVIRQPGGFKQMALFNAANCLRMLVLATPIMVARVSTPILCNLKALNDLLRYRRLLRTCLALSVALAATAAAILSLLADPLLRIFGKDFSQGGNALALIMAAAVVEVVAVLLYQPLFAHGRLWAQFRINLLWSSVLLVGAWLGAASGGAAALAASYLAAWVCAAAAYGVVARQLARSDSLSLAARSVSGV